MPASAIQAHETAKAETREEQLGGRALGIVAVLTHEVPPVAECDEDPLVQIFH